VTVGLHEGKAGFIDTSAQAQPGFGYPGRKSTESFLVAEQGIELLLTLLHDDEPVPEIFDATLDFLSSCSSTDVLCPTSEVLAFKLTLLRSLGLLPESKDLPGSNEALESLCSEIITEHATRAQKAQKIISAMM